MDNINSEQQPNIDPRSSKEREIERKRARGEVSCAECRRLKLKCDKKLPCSTCVRRGCPTICPNGTLASRQGNKYVLADTEKLHHTLAEMSRRIRQLEDALQISHASASSMPHPLLSEEKLAIKYGADVQEDEGKELSNPDWDIYTSFGTLTVSEKGETRFVGRSSSEALMAAVEREDGVGLKDQIIDKLPPELAHLTESFPFTPVNASKAELLSLIKERLPSYERATALVEAYLQHLSWFFRPVKREQIMEELIPMFYKRPRTAVSDDPDVGFEAHHLALLLGVFAAGAAGDLTLEPLNEEGEMYRQLGRSALSLHSIFEGTSLVTVQALALIAVYDFFSCSTQTLDSAWKLASMALCLASSIGLHWDPTSWDMDKKQIERRRSVFWELCSFDCWKSLGSGRPAVFHMHEIDCQYPQDTDVNIATDGKAFSGFWAWKHDFARNIISVIADRMCTVRPTKYSEILELDRKVRDYKITPYASPDADSVTVADHPAFLMISLYREITLLFIHRNFFARAMQENPLNPVRSRFAPSFLAAYACSITILRTLRLESSRRSQPLLQRQWPLWAHALAAAVVVGTVAARETPSELSQSALRELEHAIEVFDMMTQHPVVRNGITILLRIRENARRRASTGPNPDSSSPNTSNADVEEALRIIGGATRFVKKSVKHLRGSPVAGTPPPSSSGGLPTPASLNASLPDTVHVNSGTNSAPTSQITTGENSGSGPYDQLAREQAVSFNSPDTFGSSAGGSKPQQNYPPTSNAAMATSWLSPGVMTPLPTSFATPSFQPSAPAEQNTNSTVSEGPMSYLNQFDLNAGIPDLLFAPDFQMNLDDMNMNFDFDVGGGISVDPQTASQLDMQFNDPAIAEAWRSILEDPRFMSSGVGTGLP